MKNLNSIFPTAISSFLTEGLYRTSIPIAATSLSEDASSVGISIAISKFPWIFVSIIAGFAIDRYSPFSVIRAGALIRFFGLLILSIFLLLGELTFSRFLIISFFMSTCDVAIELSTQASIPASYSSSEIPRANAKIYQTQMLFSQLLAPTIAGILLASGLNLFYISVTIIQLFVIFFAYRCPPRNLQNFPSRSMDGKRFSNSSRDPTLRGMFVVSALMMASYGVWSSSFALYALKINDGLEANTMEYGIMMAFIAIGALIGSELISRHRLHARGFILICLSSICIFLLPISCIFSKNKILIIIMIFIYGISLSAWNIVAVSYRQKFIPHHIFGRINGVYRTVSWGFMPIGALVGAGIVEKFDYQAAFGISALISIFQIFALPLMKNIQRQYQ